MSERKKNDMLPLTSEDWDMLLPGTPVQLGKSTRVIRPLGVTALKTVISQAMVLLPQLRELGITADNYETPENLLKLADIIWTAIPEVLAEASGLCVEDIKRLPLSAAANVLAVVITVNVESQDSLTKNLKALWRR